MVEDPGAQNGTLAHAARTVKERKAGGNHIVGNDFPFLFAPETPQRVFVGVRFQTDIGRIRHGSLPLSLLFSGHRGFAYPLRQVLKPGLERRDVVFQANVKDFDVSFGPGLLINLLWINLNGPRLEPELQVAPDAIKDNPQVPIAQTVTQKQKVANLQLLADRRG